MKWIKRKIRNYLLRHIFKAVLEENVFTFDSKTGSLYLDGKLLDEREAKQLQEEAKFIKRTWLWEVFQKTLRHQAHKIMIDKSTTYEDMVSGKMMLYNLDVQTKIVDKLAP